MRVLAALTAAAVFCLALVPAVVPARAEPIKIKFGHGVAETAPKGLGALMFKKLAEERLPGKVIIEVYPNYTLFTDDAEMEALALGDVQIIAPSLIKCNKFSRKLQVFDLPFIFQDAKAVEQFQQSDVGRALLASLRPKGYQGLAYWRNGMRQITANRPIRRPEDARGLRFRTQSSEVLLEQFRVIGALPQRMTFSEVYRALQEGSLDGQESTWSNIHAQALHEVQRYATETNHGVLGYMVLANAPFWSKLPADIRGELERSMGEVTVELNKLADELNLADRERISASGLTEIIVLAEADLAAWRKAMHPVYGKFEGEIGKDVIEAALAANRLK